MCEFCQWQDTLKQIDDMVNSDSHRFAWAFDTLTGIGDTIESKGHATDNQKRAIENIGMKR